MLNICKVIFKNNNISDAKNLKCVEDLLIKLTHQQGKPNETDVKSVQKPN